MTENEIQTIIDMIAESRGRALDTLSELALRTELPSANFDRVLIRLTKAAATERWLTAAHALNDQEDLNASKHDAADQAWAWIKQSAQQGDGLLALIANIDSIRWPDRRSRQAFIDARSVIRRSPETTAKFAFRDAYQALRPDGLPKASLSAIESPAPTANLLEESTDPDPDSNSVDPSEVLNEMRTMLRALPDAAAI